MASGSGSTSGGGSGGGGGSSSSSTTTNNNYTAYARTPSLGAATGGLELPGVQLESSATFKNGAVLDGAGFRRLFERPAEELLNLPEDQQVYLLRAWTTVLSSNVESAVRVAHVGASRGASGAGGAGETKSAEDEAARPTHAFSQLVNNIWALIAGPGAVSSKAVVGELVALLGALFAPGIERADLLRFFKLFQQGATHASAVSALHVMALAGERNHNRPCQFFSLGGHDELSGTVPGAAWPFSKEYLFAAWVRVEQFASGAVESSLLRIVSSNGSSLDLTLSHGAVTVKVSSGGKFSHKILSNAVTTGRWLFIAIHQYSKWLSSEVVVLVNGRQLYEGNLPLVKVTATDSACVTIGAGLNGQVGPCHLFTAGLTPAALAALTKAYSGDSTVVPAALSENAELMSKLWTVVHPRLVDESQRWQDVTSAAACVTWQLSGCGISWAAFNVRDTIASIGGVTALLPLFGDDEAMSDDAERIYGESRLTLLLKMIATFLARHKRNQFDAHQTDFFGLLRLLLDDSKHLRSRGCLNCRVLPSALVHLGNILMHTELKASAWANIICWFPLWAEAPLEVWELLFQLVTFECAAQREFFHKHVGVTLLWDATRLTLSDAALDSTVPEETRTARASRNAFKMSEDMRSCLLPRALRLICVCIGAGHAVDLTSKMSSPRESSGVTEDDAVLLLRQLTVSRDTNFVYQTVRCIRSLIEAGYEMQADGRSLNLVPALQAASENALVTTLIVGLFGELSGSTITDALLSEAVRTISLVLTHSSSPSSSSLPVTPFSLLRKVARRTIGSKSWSEQFSGSGGFALLQQVLPARVIGSQAYLSLMEMAFMTDSTSQQSQQAAAPVPNRRVRRGSTLDDTAIEVLPKTSSAILTDADTIMAPEVLELLFKMLPRLSPRIQHLFMEDMLRLLKASGTNRDTVYETEGWQSGMFAAISWLQTDHTVPSPAAAQIGEAKADSGADGSDAAESLPDIHSSGAGDEVSGRADGAAGNSPGRPMSPEEAVDREAVFELGMQVFVTILHHRWMSQGGWQDLEYIMALQPLGSGNGTRMCRILCSRLLVQAEDYLAALQRDAKWLDTEAMSDTFVTNLVYVTLLMEHVISGLASDYDAHSRSTSESDHGRSDVVHRQASDGEAAIVLGIQLSVLWDRMLLRSATFARKMLFRKLEWPGVGTAAGSGVPTVCLLHVLLRLGLLLLSATSLEDVRMRHCASRLRRLIGYMLQAMVSSGGAGDGTGAVPSPVPGTTTATVATGVAAAPPRPPEAPDQVPLASTEMWCHWILCHAVGYLVRQKSHEGPRDLVPIGHVLGLLLDMHSAKPALVLDCVEAPRHAALQQVLDFARSSGLSGGSSDADAGIDAANLDNWAPICGEWAEEPGWTAVVAMSVEGISISQSRLSAFVRSRIQRRWADYLSTEARWAGSGPARDLKKAGLEVWNRLSSTENTRAATSNWIRSTQFQQASVSWHRLVRQLQLPRSAWVNAEYLVAHWRLRSHEDMIRRRMQLRRNFEFDPHSDAAFRRADEVAGAARSPQLSQPTVAKALLDPTAASATVASGDGDTESGSDNDEEKAGDASVPTPTVMLRLSSTVREPSAGDGLTVEQRDAMSHGGLLPGETHHYNMTCSRVTPLKVIAGTLRVTNLFLSFEPAVPTGGSSSSEAASGSAPRASSKSSGSKRWSLMSVRAVQPRRYLLQPCALEIFFSTGSSVFLVFEEGMREKVFHHIRRFTPPHLLKIRTLASSKQHKTVGLTEQWRRREISNFEYLMHLNTLAGRSYNDTTQYPVFPWILVDYTSPVLDLENPATFRDLSKPVGALNPARAEEFAMRYTEFVEEGIPRFHYGSHYSSSGMVMWYLMRLEPFTTQHIQLQSGRFDCPDRLFHSVAECFTGCLLSMSDVKELVPEFFCLPEFLRNESNFDLGERQDGAGRVHHVDLPPWASSPYDFIFKHREALECELVSMNLHHWIDLIFGHKQRGPEAVKAQNVFYYLTYEGAVDVRTIEDPIQRRAMCDQVFFFGQTPSQLFTSPHPQRRPADDCGLGLLHPGIVVRDALVTGQAATSSSGGGGRPHGRARAGSGSGLDTPAPGSTNPNSMNLRTLTTSAAHGDNNTVDVCTLAPVARPRPYPPVRLQVYTPERQPAAAPPVVGLHVTESRVTAFHADHTVSVHKWENIADYKGKPFLFKPEKDRNRELGGAKVSCLSNLVVHYRGEGARQRNDVSARNTPYPWAMFAVSEMGSNSTMFSGGYRDGLLRCDLGRTSTVVEGGHNDTVTCLVMAEDNMTLVTGSADLTCRVWQVHTDMMLRDEMQAVMDLLGTAGNRQAAIPGAVLLGHEGVVTAVAASSGMDLVASGAADGTVLLHTMVKGHFIREIRARGGGSVCLLKLTSMGEVVSFSESPNTLTVTTVNGYQVATCGVERALTCMVASVDGRWLVTGDRAGNIFVWSIRNLSVVQTVSVEGHGGIVSLALSVSEQCLFVGCEDGQVLVSCKSVRGICVCDGQWMEQVCTDPTVCSKALAQSLKEGLAALGAV